jgi:pilus assembly protein Flp/PilA
MRLFHILLRCHAGATAIEYGLIAALIAVAIMTAVGGMGSTLKSTFSKTSSGVSTASAA